MSAPSIPNLHTLRRGGGRSRARGGRAGPPPRQPLSPEAVVQGTDLDASVSRLSAVSLGYLEDPFARAMTPPGSETRRMPLINRGSYVRTTAIDTLVSRFLSSTPSSKKQILSLGAGTDTRVFRLFASCPHLRDSLVYHEIDFATNTAAKIRLIRTNAALQEALGIERSKSGGGGEGEGGKEEVVVSEEGDALHTSRYHVHPLDLRCLKPSTKEQDPSDAHAHADTGAVSLPGIDPTLPTLVISECCLVYLSPTEATNVVAYLTQTLFPPSTPLGLILYEPIRPDDAFGRTMVSNLATRGIQLPTLQQYATLDAQRERLREQGFASGQAAAEVDFIWERWVSGAEKERVGALEMLDEMEEWKLLAQHYCVAWGWRDANSNRNGEFEGWRGLERQ